MNHEDTFKRSKDPEKNLNFEIFLSLYIKNRVKTFNCQKSAGHKVSPACCCCCSSSKESRSIYCLFGTRTKHFVGKLWCMTTFNALTIMKWLPRLQSKMDLQKYYWQTHTWGVKGNFAKITSCKAGVSMIHSAPDSAKPIVPPFETSFVWKVGTDGRQT